VMFPQGTDVDYDALADLGVTSDDFGNVYAFRKDKTDAGAIKAAAKNNTLTQLLGHAELGMGAPDKADIQGTGIPVVVRDANGVEIQSTLTDAAHLQQTMAASQALMPPGGSVSVEPAEGVLAGREGEAPAPTNAAELAENLAQSVEGAQAAGFTPTVKDLMDAALTGAEPIAAAKVNAEDEELYAKALEVVREAGKASTPLLQRHLGLGYGAAARILDRMHAEGIIGPPDGYGQRELLKPQTDALAAPEPLGGKPAKRLDKEAIKAEAKRQMREAMGLPPEAAPVPASKEEGAEPTASTLRAEELAAGRGMFDYDRYGELRAQGLPHNEAVEQVDREITGHATRAEAGSEKPQRTRRDRAEGRLKDAVEYLDGGDLKKAAFGLWKSATIFPEIVSSEAYKDLNERLQAAGVTIKDHTGDPFNEEESFNRQTYTDKDGNRHQGTDDGSIEDIHFTRSPGLEAGYVNETIEPTIYQHGKVISPAKIMVTVPADEATENAPEHAEMVHRLTYFTGSSGPAVEAVANKRGDIGLMLTPLKPDYINKAEHYPFIAIDNGAFSTVQEFSAEKFLKLLDAVAAKPEVAAKVQFVVAPDIVYHRDGKIIGDAAATLAQFPMWAIAIKERGLPVALAAQNGLEDMLDQIPWDDFDTLFIAGDDAWKLGNLETEEARRKWKHLMAVAVNDYGKKIHVGRVNSFERSDYSAFHIGAISVDGTHLKHGPTDGLARIESWLNRINDRHPSMGPKFKNPRPDQADENDWSGDPLQFAPKGDAMWESRNDRFLIFRDGDRFTLVDHESTDPNTEHGSLKAAEKAARARPETPDVDEVAEPAPAPDPDSFMARVERLMKEGMSQDEAIDAAIEAISGNKRVADIMAAPGELGAEPVKEKAPEKREEKPEPAAEKAPEKREEKPEPKTYEELQQQIDEKIDELESRGQNVYQMYHPDAQNRPLPGWTAMPADLADLYRKRDDMQRREADWLKAGVDERLADVVDEDDRPELIQALSQANLPVAVRGDYPTESWRDLAKIAQAALDFALKEVDDTEAVARIESRLSGTEDEPGPSLILRANPEGTPYPSRFVFRRAQEIVDAVLPDSVAIPRFPVEEPEAETEKPEAKAAEPEAEEPEKAEPEAEKPDAMAAPEPLGAAEEEKPEAKQPVKFVTSQGSQYEAVGAGTRRYKATTEREYEPSDSTVYLAPDVAKRVTEELQSYSRGMNDASVRRLPDGQVGLVVENAETGAVRNDLSRTLPHSEKPAMGLHPLELWNDRNPRTGEYGFHIGHPIVAIQNTTREPSEYRLERRDKFLAAAKSTPIPQDAWDRVVTYVRAPGRKGNEIITYSVADAAGLKDSGSDHDKFVDNSKVTDAIFGRLIAEKYIDFNPKHSGYVIVAETDPDALASHEAARRAALPGEITAQREKIAATQRWIEAEARLPEKKRGSKAAKKRLAKQTRALAQQKRDLGRMKTALRKFDPDSPVLAKPVKAKLGKGEDWVKDTNHPRYGEVMDALDLLSEEGRALSKASPHPADNSTIDASIEATGIIYMMDAYHFKGASIHQMVEIGNEEANAHIKRWNASQKDAALHRPLDMVRPKLEEYGRALLAALNGPKEAKKAKATPKPADAMAAPEPLGHDGAPQLPAHLSKAKPRYAYGDKQFLLNFGSDLDRAAYITAQKTPSKADAEYLNWAMSATGRSEAEIREHGAKVRGAIKSQAKDANAVDDEGKQTVLFVPDMSAGLRTKSLMAAPEPLGVEPALRPDTSRPDDFKPGDIVTVGNGDLLVERVWRTATSPAGRGIVGDGQINITTEDENGHRATFVGREVKALKLVKSAAAEDVPYSSLSTDRKADIEEYVDDTGAGWEPESAVFTPATVTLGDLENADQRPLTLDGIDRAMVGQSRTKGPVILDSDLSVIDGMHRIADVYEDAGATGTIEALIRRDTADIETEAAPAADAMAAPEPLGGKAEKSFSQQMAEAETADAGRIILSAFDDQFGALERKAGLAPTIGHLDRRGTRGASTLSRADWRRAVKAATDANRDIGARLQAMAVDYPAMDAAWERLYKREQAQKDQEWEASPAKRELDEIQAIRDNWKKPDAATLSDIAKMKSEAASWMRQAETQSGDMRAKSNHEAQRLLTKAAAMEFGNTGPKSARGPRVNKAPAATNKGVSDLPVRATINGDTVDIVISYQRSPVAKFQFPVSDWNATLRFPNPNYPQRRLAQAELAKTGIEQWIDNSDNERMNGGVINRLADSVAGAVREAMKSAPAPTEKVKPITDAQMRRVLQWMQPLDDTNKWSELSPEKVHAKFPADVLQALTDKNYIGLYQETHYGVTSEGTRWMAESKDAPTTPAAAPKPSRMPPIMDERKVKSHGDWVRVETERLKDIHSEIATAAEGTPWNVQVVTAQLEKALPAAREYLEKATAAPEEIRTKLRDTIAESEALIAKYAKPPEEAPPEAPQLTPLKLDILRRMGHGTNGTESMLSVFSDVGSEKDYDAANEAFGELIRDGYVRRDSGHESDTFKRLAKGTEAVTRKPATPQGPPAAAGLDKEAIKAEAKRQLQEQLGIKPAPAPAQRPISGGDHVQMTQDDGTVLRGRVDSVSDSGSVRVRVDPTGDVKYWPLAKVTKQSLASKPAPKVTPQIPALSGSTPLGAKPEPRNALSDQADADAAAMREELRIRRERKKGLLSRPREDAEADIDPQDMIRLTRIGAERMLAGALKYDDWARQMTDKIGDVVEVVAEDAGLTAPEMLQLVHEYAREVAQDFGVTAEETPKEVKSDGGSGKNQLPGEGGGGRSSAQNPPSLGGISTEDVQGDEGGGDSVQGGLAGGGRHGGHAGESAPSGPGSGQGAGNRVPAVAGSGKKTRTPKQTGALPALGADPTLTDFTLTPEEAEAIESGGAKTKARDNVEAIRTIKLIQAEGNRSATPEEKAKLARYVGWGATEMAQGIFKDRDASWAGIREDLRGLLTPEEWETAKDSTINAHYTRRDVAAAMWGALQQMGFRGFGSVLEPGMGVGNFFMMMPSDMQGAARRTGVEMELLTGAIAKALYPASNIMVQPFQDTNLPNDYFDAAIGNVPFQGGISIYDPQFRREPYLTNGLHNYFFAKTMTKLRPGGVMLMISARGTMDAPTWKPFREWMAKQGEFLGAIRLPRDTFKANAGTAVTVDVIAFRKRVPGESISTETWTTSSPQPLGTSGETFHLNEYYQRHPEMMMGQMGEGSHYRKNYPELLGTFSLDTFKELLAKLPENIIQSWAEQPENQLQLADTFPDAKLIKDGQFVFHKGALVRRVGAYMEPVPYKGKRLEAAKGLIAIRGAVRESLRAQGMGLPEATILSTRADLNRIYDKFVKEFGPINKRGNVLALGDDPDWPLLSSLEKWDAKTETAKKADLFTERTNVQLKRVESADTGAGALAVSLNEFGRIDWDRMQELTGNTPRELQKELRGTIYQNPVTGRWETADEYLSGNVRQKLEDAEFAAADSSNNIPGAWQVESEDADWEPENAYARNVEALKLVQPRNLMPGEIDAPLGATFIPNELYSAFANHLLKSEGVVVTYIPATGSFGITQPREFTDNEVANRIEHGTAYFSGMNLFEMAMNGLSPVAKDEETNFHGNTVYVKNPEATIEAGEKQRRIMSLFSEWIWTDPERSKRLATKYNRELNNIRLRVFDGSHLTFPGLDRSWLHNHDLDPHQKNAVWRILVSGNTLLAHAVGAGKTLEMIVASKELRRLGMSRKPMFVVPNRLVGQWRDDYLRAYPGSNILVPTKKSLQAKKRARLMSQIATGNYDAVLVGHKAFELLPVKDETFKAFMDEQIDEVENALAAARLGKKDADRDPTVKELVRRKKALEERLKKRLDRSKKDNTVTFEEMGVDWLFVDEAHAFKNLGYMTTMDRIAGLPNTDSNRSVDMLLKSRYVSGLHGNQRGLTFATATPVSNSLAEIWTMMRYLMPDYLRDQGFDQFDAWAKTFGNRITQMEVAPEGNRMMMRTRFSDFNNAPEMMAQFRLVADIRTSAQLNLPTPAMLTGAPIDIPIQPTRHLKNFIGNLGDRADAVRGGHVDPEDDNMLKISSDGRKASLDIRLVNPFAPEDKNGKARTAAKKIVEIYKEYDHHKATQLVFLDLSTPKAEGARRRKVSGEVANTDDGTRANDTDDGTQDAPIPGSVQYQAEEQPDDVPVVDDGETEPDEDINVGDLDLYGDDDEEWDSGDTATAEEAKERFTVYSQLKKLLIEGGIPEDEIAFIQDAKTEAKQTALFAAMNAGEVRVLIGSTEMMGAGMNVQKLLVAEHHLDAPWRPSDWIQRLGRIDRQGNELWDKHQIPIQVYRYVTEGSFDAFMWQTILAKAKPITRLMEGDPSVRRIEEPAALILSAEQAMAISSGNPEIREKIILDQDINRIEIMRGAWLNEQATINQTLAPIAGKIIDANERVELVDSDIATRDGNNTLVVNGRSYTRPGNPERRGRCPG
jgi:N12 class adenine-specific DNA methylase